MTKPNLPAKSTSKGIQKAHVRNVETRTGRRPIIINPAIHHTPITKPYREVEQRRPIEQPVAFIPTSPIKLPPKERPGETGWYSFGSKDKPSEERRAGVWLKEIPGNKYELVYVKDDLSSFKVIHMTYSPPSYRPLSELSESQMKDVFIQAVSNSDDLDIKKYDNSHKALREYGIEYAKPMPERLIIEAKKWFDEEYGNTYHSVELFINGRRIGKEVLRYGYDEAFLQTAFEMLKREGYKTGEYYGDFKRMLNENPQYKVSVKWVKGKGDL